MGSGRFPQEGFGRSAHIRDNKITNDHGVPINIVGHGLQVDQNVMMFHFQRKIN